MLQNSSPTSDLLFEFLGFFCSRSLLIYWGFKFIVQESWCCFSFSLPLTKCLRILKEVKLLFEEKKPKTFIFDLCELVFCPVGGYFQSKLTFIFVCLSSEQNHEWSAKLLNSLCSQIQGNSWLKVKTIQHSCTKKIKRRRKKNTICILVKIEDTSQPMQMEIWSCPHFRFD